MFYDVFLDFGDRVNLPDSSNSVLAKYPLSPTLTNYTICTNTVTFQRIKVILARIIKVFLSYLSRIKSS